MIARLLYMIPFFGMVTGAYFIFSMNMAAAYLVAGFSLTQGIICFLYLILNISEAGIDGTLEVEVQLWDALMPVIFLMVSATSSLVLITYTLNTTRGLT